jgi:3-hydroxyisobutyrate dehydrogenase
MQRGIAVRKGQHMTMRIAFIGLGHMGLPMAANLSRSSDYTVVGFDLVPDALEAARELGIAVETSAARAAADADVVITMLPIGRHVIAAYLGTDGEPGLLAAVKPHSFFIECSTIAVDDAREVHRMAAAAGHRNVDAPVSGGVVGAEAGSLTFMVGGDDPDFVEAQPILSTMGGRIIHCGGPGVGQAAKVCNNLILGASMIAVSEAFVLGERLGLSNQALFDVASAASGQCWALTTNCPVPGPVPSSPANKDYAPGFAGALMAKDLGLAVHAIKETGVQAQIASLAEAIYRRFAEEGGAGQDFSAIINTVRAAGDPAVL